MDNPGVYTLIAQGITTPLSAQAFTPITELDGISAANLACVMLGGSGGTTIDVLAQTSFDDGMTWLDVAHFSFTTSSETKFATLNALASKAVTVYAPLGSEGVNDGLLGNQFRGVITSVDTYANTSIALYLHAK